MKLGTPVEVKFFGTETALERLVKLYFVAKRGESERMSLAATLARGLPSKPVEAGYSRPHAALLVR